MIEETDKRIIGLMLDKIDRLTDLVNNHRNEITTNYFYSDTLQFEFQKLFEDISHLSLQLLVFHPELPINKLRAIRNRVAHNYESVVLDILIDSVTNDFPSFKESLIIILND